MSPETSAAAVALRAPVNGYARLPPAGVVVIAEPAQVAANGGTIPVARTGRQHGVRRLVSVLGDLVGLVAVVVAFPLVILAVGIPIALLVRLVMWVFGASRW